MNATDSIFELEKLFSDDGPFNFAQNEEDGSVIISKNNENVGMASIPEMEHLIGAGHLYVIVASVLCAFGSRLPKGKNESVVKEFCNRYRFRAMLRQTLLAATGIQQSRTHAGIVPDQEVGYMLDDLTVLHAKARNSLESHVYELAPGVLAILT